MEPDKYTVVRIDDPDYGCEGVPDGEIPMATVTLQSTAGEKKRLRASDELLYAAQIDEGDTVIFSSDGSLQKYKTVSVVAAILCDDLQCPKTFFGTARGYGEFRGLWEFPGGKVEPGETKQQALIREIREELEISILVGPLYMSVEHDYPTFHLSMDCYLAEIADGTPVLKEASAGTWFTADTLQSVCWLPADQALIQSLVVLARRNGG